MRILLVSSYAHQASGQFCWTLGRWLSLLGQDVTVLILEPSAEHRIKSAAMGFRLVNPRLSLGVRIGFCLSPSAVPEILLRSWTVIHAQNLCNWGTLLSAVRGRVTRIPVLVTVHTGLTEFPRMIDGAFRRVAGWVLDAASAVGLLSSFHEEVLRRDGILRGRKRTFLTRVPVDEALYGIPRSPRPIRHGLYVGRVERLQKAIPRLLPIFDRLKDSGIRFTIVGDGEYRPELEETIEDRGWSHVATKGWVPNWCLVKIFSEADFFIMPSRYETQPRALLEAMASGLPIIAPAIPGVTEFCPSEAAYFIEDPDDPSAWENAILRLGQDPERSHNMGMVARRAVAGNHPRVVAAEHLRIYRMLVNS
jgi:glycosyltransferase involved in cell wall biosynthesis